jgi:ribosomal protein L10
MNVRQKKFHDIKKVYKLLNSNNHNIFLITHVSNLNMIQMNLLKTFCDQNDIKNIYIKLNLLKKLTKNDLFSNLLAGPSKIFFFQDSKNLINFLKNNPVEKKIIPLAVYFNDNFYSYSFFISRLKKFLSLNQFNKEQFILTLNNKNSNFIHGLKQPMNNFIRFLSHYKNNQNN